MLERLRAVLEMTRWQKTDEHRRAEEKLREQQRRVAVLALRVDNIRRK